MYAIKDDEVLVEGKRNITDGLYDIPIYKNLIHKNNYVEPQHHGLSYKLPKTNSIVQSTPTEQPKEDNRKLFRIFYGLNKPIDVNECDLLCNKQQKEDTRKYQKVSINQKINVILRKDKTKQDLAQFHHASLYSPVQLTLIQAIKKN